MNAYSLNLEINPECTCSNKNKCFVHRDELIANYDTYHIINNIYNLYNIPKFYNKFCYKNVNPLLDTDNKPFHKQNEIFVKLPSHFKSHRERLIYSDDLKHDMQNHGFDFIKSTSINYFFSMDVYEKISEQFYHNIMNLLYNLSINDIAVSIYKFLENSELIILSCTNKSIYNMCKNERLKRFSLNKNRRNNLYKKSEKIFLYDWDGSMNGLLLNNIDYVCHSSSSFS